VLPGFVPGEIPFTIAARFTLQSIPVSLQQLGQSDQIFEPKTGPSSADLDEWVDSSRIRAIRQERL